MNKVFKYYAIAPLTYGNIFSTDDKLKLKDFEIIYHGTKYTCDSEDVSVPSEKNFLKIDQLKQFIKNDELANKIIKLVESNIDETGKISENLCYIPKENLSKRKIKLYIDEKIETNNPITINDEDLGKYYIIPLETIDYLIQEKLEKGKFDSEDDKELKYNEKLLYYVKYYTFRDSINGLIKSYQIGDDEEVNIDECLNLEDVKKIYQGIKNNKTIKIKTIEQTNNSYRFVHYFKDENKMKKFLKIYNERSINPNFCLEKKDLGAYLQKKLDIEENIEFETVHDNESGIDNITIKIPEEYSVDKFFLKFVSENDKKYIKADIRNKAMLKLYDFNINPPYADIAKKLKEDYGLDDSNYTLKYNDETISKDQKIITETSCYDIVVILKDNTANKDSLTDEKPKEITLRIIGETCTIDFQFNDLKNNKLLKFAHDLLKIIKKTNDISNFDIKFYKDEEAKEEIQIPDDDNINFEYKEGEDNTIYISISEKEKDKRDKEKDKERDKNNDHTNDEDDTKQSGESNKKKKKYGCC